MQADRIYQIIQDAENTAKRLVRGGLAGARAVTNPLGFMASQTPRAIRAVSNLKAPGNNQTLGQNFRSAISDVKQNPNNYNLYSQMAKPGFTPKVVEPLTMATGGFIQNRVIQPALDIPKNAQMAIEGVQQAQQPGQRWEGTKKAGLGALGVLGGLSPGIEDIGFAGYDAMKAKMAGKSGLKAFGGQEYTGLGDAIARGKETPISSTLNTLELPLMLAVGGAKALKKSSTPKPPTNPLEALKVEARKYKSAEEFIKAQQPEKVTFKSAKANKDYMGGHEAPMAEDINAPIWDLTGKYTGNNLYPDDVYSSNARNLYSSGFDYDGQAMSILQSVKNRPNARVTVYRAVPKDIKGEINAGDWITLTKDYAKEHGESNLGGKYKIIKKEVFARDIFTDANSIQEFGYDPQPRLDGKDVPPDLLKNTFDAEKQGKKTIYSSYISQLTDIYNQSKVAPQGLDLTQEARKYKSAEEFVADQSKYVYHNSSLRNLEGIKQEGLVRDLANVYDDKVGKKIFFSEEPSVAKYFGGGETQGELSPLVFRIKKSELGGNFTEKQLSMGKEIQFGGDVIPPNKLEVLLDGVWQPLTGNKVVATPKSQLTDLWNQSQVKPNLPADTRIPQTLDKPKLPDELQIPSTAKPKLERKVINTDPIINTKRDIPIKDVHGQRAVLPAGEAYTPYLTSDNKVLLKDGDEFLVNKSVYQNVKGQSIKSEAKPFAPELEGLDETVKIDTGKIDSRKIRQLEEKADLARIQGDTNKAQELMRQADLLNKPTPTKYSQYTLPGGENYREILIKAPETKQVNPVQQARLDLEKQGITFEQEMGGEVLLVNKKGDYLEFDDLPTKTQELVETAAGNADDYTDFVKAGQSGFKSSHWDEPNVLAHTRINDRTYNGKKVSFMEELQSDWAREARANNIESNIGKLDTISKQLYSKPYNELSDALKKQTVSDLRLKEIPDHPLLKNWQEPTIKRALKDAVDNDAEYFAWINGDQTSARYNLATVVNDIDWHPQGKLKIANVNTKEAGKLELMLKDGKILEIGGDAKAITQAQNWKGKNLDEVLGKGLADKIMADENGTLSGEGLKFGGEWANNLYDKQVKNIVEKLTGGKVEVIDMGLPIEAKRNKSVFIDPRNTYDTRYGIKPEEIGTKFKTGSELQLDKVDNNGYIERSRLYIITDVLGDGKFRAIRKGAFKELSDYVSGKLKGEQLRLAKELEETFDISVKPATQQAIRLTPEIKARIRSEAPPVKQPSGKLPDLLQAFK